MGLRSRRAGLEHQGVNSREKGGMGSRLGVWDLSSSKRLPAAGPQH